MRPEQPASGTPLSRYAEWYGALPADLRAHLAPLLFGEGPVGLSIAGGDPARDADRAAELAARTDAALADPAVRERWTGEGALAGLDGASHDAPRRTIREHAVSRSVEWLRAVEQWALLRARGLAGRRIERWRVKSEGSDGRTDRPSD